MEVIGYYFGTIAPTHTEALAVCVGLLATVLIVMVITWIGGR